VCSSEWGGVGRGDFCISAGICFPISLWGVFWGGDHQPFDGSNAHSDAIVNFSIRTEK
jgi:hypothetical protein